jgi:hypothetical protein
VKRGHPEYVLSGADLAEFANCPSRWLEGVEDEGTKSTLWGSLIDCLLMAPFDFPSLYAVAPETYKVVIKSCPSCGSVSDAASCRKCKVEREEHVVVKPWDFKATICQEWEEQQGGKTIIKAGLFAEAEKAADLITRDPQVAELFKASRKQVMLTGFYDDEETGLRIPVKALLDLAPPDRFLADLKTCRNAHPRAWRKQVFECGYHMQAARHLDLWNAATNENRREFRHYIQENFAPYQTAKRILDTEFIALGRRQYVRALQRYARCIKQQHFPGYDDATNDPADVVIEGHLVTSPEAWMVGAA